MAEPIILTNDGKAKYTKINNSQFDHFWIQPIFCQGHNLLAYIQPKKNTMTAVFYIWHSNWTLSNLVGNLMYDISTKIYGKNFREEHSATFRYILRSEVKLQQEAYLMGLLEHCTLHWKQLLITAWLWQKKTSWANIASPKELYLVVSLLLGAWRRRGGMDRYPKNMQ